MGQQASGQDPPPEDRRAPELDEDFAQEHARPTYADDQAGGQERSAETESPKGYAGMDPSWRFLRRWWRKR